MERTNVVPQTQMSCEDMLKQVCLMYEEIDLLYHSLSKRVSRPTSSVYQQIMARLNQLYHEAGIVDKQLQQRLNATETGRTSIKELLEKRRSLLEGLLSKNKVISTNARKITSYLKHEIGTMGKSRGAITGYKPVKNERRNIINNTY
jgi:small-conductance mechanosensitive channel